MTTGTMIPFGNLVKAEVRKTTDTRAARWLLGVTVLLTFAAAAVPVAFPHAVTQNRASFLTWAALGLTRLLPIALILAMAGEWSERNSLTTFTLEPRRGRVLAAKVAAGLGLSVIGLVLSFASAELGVVVADAAGRHVVAGWNWAELAGVAAFIMLISGIGIALGSAVHNTAAAIVTYFAIAALSSLLLIPAVQRIGNWVNTTTTFGWVLTGAWSGHGAQIATSAAIWIALPLAIGIVRFTRRDIH
jgi:ABC-2 type transport system permease protein